MLSALTALYTVHACHVSGNGMINEVKKKQETKHVIIHDYRRFSHTGNYVTAVTM